MGRDLSKQPVLAVMLDGSDALKRSLLEFFPDAVIQRCLVHKERNLRRYLPQKHWLRLSQLFADLRKCEGSEAASEALESLKAFLANKNKAARESLDEPGEELLAFFRLEVASTLNTTFLSTNIIENAIKNLRRHIGRVCRWRDKADQPEHWIASGLQLAQRGFRRVRGHRDLDQLQKALKRPEKGELAA